MASATTKPQKRLGDFLNEQQEPFILELYLVERYYSKGLSLNGDSSNNMERSANCGLNKKRKRKVQFPFCKVLTTLLNKFAFQRKKHASMNHTVQFSSARNSCLDIVDEEDNLSSNKDQHSFSSHINQTCNVLNMRWQKQRSIEGSIKSLGNIPLPRKPNADETVNEDVGGVQNGVQSCGVLMPKKITEDSLISVAIWNLIAPSVKKEECVEELQEVLPTHDISQILKSKRVSQNIKKQLFDCVRDGTMIFPTKDNRMQLFRQFKGPIEVGKLICQRTKEWSQQHTRDGVNLTQLLTMDYLDSNIEWSKFKTYVHDIGVEISDEILEYMNNEIVSEMIGTLASNGFIFPPALSHE